MIFVTGNGNTIITFESALNAGNTKTISRYYAVTFGIVAVQTTSSPMGEKGKCFLLSTDPIAVMMNK